MLQYRKGEEEQTRFRADRIFKVAEYFYFNTREGNEVGPFPSRRSAEDGIERYIKCILTAQDSGVYASQIALKGLWASTNYS